MAHFVCVFGVFPGGTIASFSTSVLTANDLTQLQVVSVSGAAVTSGALLFDAATQTFTYDSTNGVGAGALSFSYTLSDGSIGNVTFDVVNANGGGFNLAAAYPTAGSYQGAYLDAGGGPGGRRIAAPHPRDRQIACAARRQQRRGERAAQTNSHHQPLPIQDE